jgi:hypothetical protein
MRFRNSGITLVCNKVTSQKALIGAAFHATTDRISGTPITRVPWTGFSTANVSARSICSKVTNSARRALSRVRKFGLAGIPVDRAFEPPAAQIFVIQTRDARNRP